MCVDCYEYTVDPLGSASVSWTNCDGTSGSGTFTEITIIPCAQEGSVLNEGGDPIITQGSYCGNSCVPPSTTTTTTTLVCDDCYSYTVTANPTATIQWINCNETAGEATLSDPTPYEIPCAVENSVVVMGGVATVTIGTLCGNTCPTTTTTTSSSSTTTTTTTLPQCLYYNLFASNKGPVTFEYIVCDQTSVTTVTVPASTNISVCAETSYGIVITSGSLNGGFTILGACP